LFTSCGKKDVIKSCDKEISSFSFASISDSVSTSIDNTTASGAISAPFGTDVTSLSPTIAISAKATIQPASGVAQNFSTPVAYTVTTEDGSKKNILYLLRYEK
jgi:hypothetical protein